MRDKVLLVKKRYLRQKVLRLLLLLVEVGRRLILGDMGGSRRVSIYDPALTSLSD
jgi:hypothetical protein